MSTPLFSILIIVSLFVWLMWLYADACRQRDEREAELREVRRKFQRFARSVGYDVRFDGPASYSLEYVEARKMSDALLGPRIVGGWPENYRDAAQRRP